MKIKIIFYSYTIINNMLRFSKIPPDSKIVISLISLALFSGVGLGLKNLTTDRNITILRKKQNQDITNTNQKKNIDYSWIV